MGRDESAIFTCKIRSFDSGGIHGIPTWRRSLQTVQKLKKQFEHIACWSSSMQGVSHLGQMAISDIDSSVFCNTKDSHCSYFSSPSNCFNREGGSIPPQFASGQWSLLMVPSLRWISEKVFMHFQQKKCWHGSLMNSVPWNTNLQRKNSITRILDVQLMINLLMVDRNTKKCKHQSVQRRSQCDQETLSWNQLQNGSSLA